MPERRSATPEIDPEGIRRVLDLLERYEVRQEMERHVRTYHDRANAALETAVLQGSDQAAAALRKLVESLASRTG